MNRTVTAPPQWSEGTHPRMVISWALANYPTLTMTSGFNLNGIVLIDLAVDAGYRGEVLFVDTGYHFGETLATRDTLVARYPELDFVTLSAGRPDDRMFTHDVDRCCALRKVAPLQDFFEERSSGAVLSARSRDQNESRSTLEFVERSDRDQVNPLIHWSRPVLEDYARSRSLPLNPLYHQGLLSIGCAPCTRAVRSGEHPRVGRWSGLSKTECGLWLDSEPVNAGVEPRIEVGSES